MSFIDLITNGLTGGALGAIGGIAEKLLTQRMTNQQEVKEWNHIREMHVLQQSLERQQAQDGLAIRETEGEYAGLSDSIKHDQSLGFDHAGELLKTHPKLGAFVTVVQTSVNTIRSLFRPVLTVHLLILTTQDPAFMPLASGAVFWWLGSRGAASGQRTLT